MWHPFISCFTVSQHCARAEVSDTSDWRIYRLFITFTLWHRQPLGTGGCLFFKRRQSRSRTDMKPAEDYGYFWRFYKYICFLSEAVSAGTSKVNWKEGKHSPAAFRMKKKWFCSDTRKILWSEISKLEPKLLQQIGFSQISRSVVKLEAGELRWDGVLSSWCLDYSRWWDATVQLTRSEVKSRLTAVVRQWGAVCWSELKRQKQSHLNQWNMNNKIFTPILQLIKIFWGTHIGIYTYQAQFCIMNYFL